MHEIDGADQGIMLLQFGVNTTADTKLGFLWWVLLEDFCRDLPFSNGAFE